MEKLEKENLTKKQINEIPANKTKSSQNNNNNINLKEEKKSNQNSFFIKKDILILFLSFLSFYFYNKSFKGCHGTQSYCLVTLSPSFFYLLGIYIMISSIISLYIIYQILQKNASFFHLIYYIPIISYLLYFVDNGSDLSHHGSYNKMIFYVLFCAFFVLFIFFCLIKYIYRNYRIIFVSLTLSLIWIIIYTNIKIRKNCDTWYNGLNGIKLENNPNFDKCKIVQPKKCWINLLDGIFDVSRILNEDCNNFRGGEKMELLKYLPPLLNSSNEFGFPITTNYTWLNESHFDRFFNNVMADIIPLDKYDINKIPKEKKPEIILNFDPITQMGQIDISINKNQELIKTRKKLYESLPLKEKPKYSNILFLYIDAISRPEFIRSMKHTQNFLSKYYYNSSKYSFYQMLKYQNFIFFTQQNVNPMFFGESMFNSNGTSILHHIKRKGYITGQANNICTRQLYDIEDNYTQNISYESFDHENIAMFCDPNFYNPENRFTPYMGPYSIRRRCLYGKDTFEYVLEYGQKFWETYLNEKKFLRLSFQDAHEGTLEVVKYLDKKLAEFLEFFWHKKYLEDTAIFLVSDHGNNMIGFYNILQVEDYVLEKTLGTWLMILPKKINVDEKNIEINQQRLVTTYDIHDTLLDMFGYKLNDKVYSRKGKSIFSEINGLERNCDFYKQDLLPLWCRCEDF